MSQLREALERIADQIEQAIHDNRPVIGGLGDAAVACIAAAKVSRRAAIIEVLRAALAAPSGEPKVRGENKSTDFRGSESDSDFLRGLAAYLDEWQFDDAEWLVSIADKLDRAPSGEPDDWKDCPACGGAGVEPQGVPADLACGFCGGRGQVGRDDKRWEQMHPKENPDVA